MDAAQLPDLAEGDPTDRGRDGARRRGSIRPAVFGLVGAVLFAVVAASWSLATPLIGAPDEAAHVVRAAAVARGQLRGHDYQKPATPASPWNTTQSEFEIPRSYADLFDIYPCFIFQPEQPVGCAPPPGDATDTVTASTYTGTYPPLYSALVGWPSLFLPASRGLWAMRMCSVVVSAALVGLALTAGRRIEGRALAPTAVLIALTPMTLYLAGVVNPSGMEITAALALWICTLAVVRPHGRLARADVVRFAVAFVALAASRPLSPAIAVGIVACVGLAAATGGQLRGLLARRDVRWAGGVAAAALVLSAAWDAWTGAITNVASTPIPGLGLTTAVHGSVSRLPQRTIEMIGYFGYLETPPPRTLVIVWSVLTVAAVVGALVLGTGRQRLVLVALSAAAVAFNVVPEALSAAHYGYVWQGRYALPVVVGVPVLAAWIVGSSGRWPRRWTRPTAIVVGVAWALGQALGQAAELRRSIVGLTHGFFTFLHGHGWNPPLPAPLLWGSAMLAALAFGAWCAVGSTEGPVTRRRGDAVHPEPGDPR